MQYIDWQHLKALRARNLSILRFRSMMLVIWFQIILLFSGLIFTTVDAYAGINIGTDLSNLPSSSNIISILNSHQITQVRLFNADAHMLKALSNTGIEVMISVTNQEILRIGQKPSMAASWINKNVAPYIPFTNITSISVGSEVLTSIPNASPILVPAMNNLYKALVASNLNDRVKVSSPFSMDVITQPFPPSTAAFNTKWNSIMLQMLQFLKNTNSFFMLNAYPYYEYIQSNGIFPLDYALLKPIPSIKEIVDPNTLFHYSNMLDAMVDAAYNSIASFNFSGIPIIVTETGWPWLGGSNESYATVENAKEYNNNLIKRTMNNNSGPPSQPDIPVNAYIYELFNEVRPGPVSERNWGVFFVNGSAVYAVDFSGSGTGNNSSNNNDNSNSSGVNASGFFCVVKPGAEEKSLRDGLNWACGPGHANCSDIQRGGPCYDPNMLKNHASYAYNDYYQKMHDKGGTCDFGGTGMLTSEDPSYGSCRFTGSSSNSSTRNVPSSPSSKSSRNILNNHLDSNLAVVCVTTLSLLCKSCLIMDFL